MEEQSTAWDFWIDVGGTFTDVIARDSSGKVSRLKLLSSGRVRGKIDQIVDGHAIQDLRRADEPPGFWEGATLTRLGEKPRSFRVVEHAGYGVLRLEDVLNESAPGASYELATGEEAPILAIRLLTKALRPNGLPACRVRLGTTKGTNALLTRTGAKTVLVTTRGFGDVLEIGDQQRPRLFELGIRKAKPLYASVIEARERVLASGEIELALDEAALREQLASAKRAGMESVAICLLNAYVNGVHEARAGEIAREAGFSFVSLSHEVAPQIKLVARAETTVLDAYLRPILQDYLHGIEAALGTAGRASSGTQRSSLLLMTSAGGLVNAAQFSGADSLLSGPAGGVVGFSRAAGAAGFARAIGFDMGGTSTDVARFEGRPELQFESVKAGVRVLAPILAIETVAAGGGSICGFDGLALQVGPQSAGAEPGPACYGKGGPLTVTDLNLFLGRVRAEDFPIPIDEAAVRKRLEAIYAQRSGEVATGNELELLAEGLLAIANQKMGLAIGAVSSAQGFDPREYALVAFGGAAAQHACAVAEQVGMSRVLLHPDASLLSALGCGLAEEQRIQSRGVYREVSVRSRDELEPLFCELEKKTQADFASEQRSRVALERLIEVRYAGTEAAFLLPAEFDSLAAQFDAQHLSRFGYLHAGRAVELVSIRVVGRLPADFSLPPSRREAAREIAAPAETQRIFIQGNRRECSIYREQSLAPGAWLTGPAMVVAPHTTLFLAPEWSLEMLSNRELVLTRVVHSEIRNTDAPGVTMELLSNALSGIAERMGHVLRNTAGSVNVKERLDFSCALFTAEGDLIVNAPHVPVHLGGMSATVKHLIACEQEIARDDVFVTNDPYEGGSHLPDVTVMTPVFLPGEARPSFFAANRAHHAEIGGITPGSMPPFSTKLGEEGVLIPLCRVIAGGESRIEELGRSLANGKYPSRSVEENLRDVSAQIAANRLGESELIALCQKESPERVEGAVKELLLATERKLRAALRKFGDVSTSFDDALDDGTAIAVKIDVRDGAIRFDFTQSGPVSPHNLNANRAIVTAAVMYCLRCFLDELIPLNQGLLAPVEIVIGEGILSPNADGRAEELPAIVGGNVETSQRVVDVILGALGLAAASQGTMNNVILGDETFGYYETICGGEGATATREGASGVHTHMTNTRITDPEVVERRIPARVEEFSIRKGSGGAGKHRGGDGIVRRWRFGKRLTLSILSQRRERAPFGLFGGGSGARGVNELHRTSGIVESLSGRALVEVEAGDVLVLKTPGGGGFGAA
jgi:5-oxoprolinase (ATP-hydrolysing)